MGGETSRSKDMAYRYGKFSFVRGTETIPGHFLQVWQIDNAGNWKLAIEWEQPLPEEKK